METPILEKETCYQCGSVMNGTICEACGQDPDECTCEPEAVDRRRKTFHYDKAPEKPGSRRQ